MYPLQSFTEIYKKVTEMFHFFTPLPNSSWNVLSLILGNFLLGNFWYIPPVKTFLSYHKDEYLSLWLNPENTKKYLKELKNIKIEFRNGHMINFTKSNKANCKYRLSDGNTHKFYSSAITAGVYTELEIIYMNATAWSMLLVLSSYQNIFIQASWITWNADGVFWFTIKYYHPDSMNKRAKNIKNDSIKKIKWWRTKN